MKRRLTLILILTAAVAVLAGGFYWYHARQKSWRYVARAELAIQAENYNKAVELATEAVAKHPNDWRGHYVLAKAHMHLGHYQEARTILQHVRDNAEIFKPNLPEVSIMLAETYSFPAKQTLASTGWDAATESIKEILTQLRQANQIISQVQVEDETVSLNMKQMVGLNETQMGSLLEVLATRMEKEADIVSTTGLKEPQEERLQASQKARAEQQEVQSHAAQVLLEVVSRDPSRKEAAEALVQLCLARKDPEFLAKARAVILPAENTSPVAKMLLILEEFRATTEGAGEEKKETETALENIRNAASQIDELQKQYPEDIQVMLKRAELAMLLSDLSTTDRLIEEILKKNPRQGQARLLKAKRLLIQGEVSEAEKILFTLKAEFSSWPEAHYTYGRAVFSSGKRELARQAMRTVTELIPDHPQARRFLAETLLEDGFYDQAFVDAQAYYRAEPNDPQAILLFVKTCSHQDQNDLALQALEKAAADQPSNPAMMMVVAEGYSILGDQQKMLEIARQVAAMKLTADPAERIAVARGMVLTGRSVEAEKILTEDLGTYPNHPEINYELGNIYAANGRNLQALECYQGALKLNYKNDQYRLSLAQLLLKIGYLEECQEILDQFDAPNARANLMRLQIKLLQGQPLSSEEMVQISGAEDKTSLSLAMSALRVGKPQQCIDLCKTALEKTPGEADFRMLLGQAYLAQGKRDACIQEWALLIQNVPRNLAHYLRLASVLLEISPIPDVEKRLLAIPGVSGDMVNIAMGQILERQGRYSDAIPWYQRVIQKRDVSEESRIMARLLIAPALARQGRTEEAIQELDAVMQNQKTFYNRACLLKAQILAASKRTAEATALLQELRNRAVEQGNSMGLISLATMYMKLNQQDSALSICEDFLKLEPRNPRAFLLKAAALKTFGKTEEMIACYRSAIQYHPGNLAIYWQLVEALDGIQDRQGALQVLDDMAMLGDAARFASLFQRGLLFQQWGLQPNSLGCFDQLIQSGYGDNPKIQLALGKIYTILGQKERAHEVYQKIPDYSSEYYAAQMRRIELVNTPEEKVKILNQLQAMYPLQSDLLQKTLNVLFDADRGPEAVSAFEAFLNKSASSGVPSVKINLGPLEALSRTGDWKSAAALSLAAARQSDQKWWRQTAVLLNAEQQPDLINTLLPEPSQAEFPDALIALYGFSKAGNSQETSRWADRIKQLEDSFQTMNPPRTIPFSQKIIIQLVLGNMEQAQTILAGLKESSDLDKAAFSELLSYVSTSRDRDEPLRLFKASLAMELGLRRLARDWAMDILKARPQSQNAAALAFSAGEGETILRDISRILQPKESLLSQALLGEVLLLDKQFDQAAELFGRIAADSHFSVTYRLKQGMALENAGRLEEALKTYRTVWEASPDNPVALNNMAYVVSELYPTDPAKLAEAINWAETAVKKAPYITEFRDTYGWILYLQGQSGRASNVLRETIKHIPENPECHYHLGMAEKALDHSDFAQWHFSTAALLGETMISEGQSLSPAVAKAVRLSKEALAQIEPPKEKQL